MSQRLALMAAMFALAAAPWIFVDWLTNDWRALLGGTAFLLIPQIFAWLRFVGLRTGRMPSAYGKSEFRAVSPTWFWLTGGLYVGLLVLFLWIVLGVVMGGTLWGF